jgi:hypothetical protein
MTHSRAVLSTISHPFRALEAEMLALLGIEDWSLRVIHS